jgi:putative spermidine/putrescine transport system permease protein
VSVAEATTVERRSAGRRLADLLHGRPRLQLGLLLSGPLGWLVVAYLGSLVVLFIAAFWRLDTFTGQVVHEYGTGNFELLAENDVYRSIVLMPLWSSYLVKVYAWRTILNEEGILNWALDPFGLRGPGFGNVATWLVFSYLWLPYMILPIYAGLERIPNSLLDASGDLGASAAATFRRVILPMAFPAVVAGSIFTFSLTLGDYITPNLVSSTQFIGNVVYSNVGVANNLPLAAAFATVPVAVMIVYLLIARRLGAFENL